MSDETSRQQQQNSQASSAGAPGAQQEASPTVALFQKAHAALVTLQRIDEQIGQLVDRRRRVQGELREAQAMLNDEIDRAAAMPEEVSAKVSFPAAARRARIGGSDAPLAEAA